METKPKVAEVEEAAAAWLIKQEESTWSSADQAALDEWLQAAPTHLISYVRLRSVWSKSAHLKALASVGTGRAPEPGVMRGLAIFDPPTEETSHDEVTPASSPVTHRRYYQAAAVLMVAVLLGFWQWSLSGRGRYETLIGGSLAAPLEDGSKITLNTDSKLRVQFSEHERRVDLQRGEAFFQIAKDASRPFVVYAAQQRVVAVGTQFSVRVESDQVRVTLTEGKVRLEREGTQGTRALANMTPGDVARLTNASIVMEHVPQETIERALSWREGYIVLRGTPLPDAVAEFNRYNERQLVIEDPSLAEITVGGKFKSDNVAGFVRLLEQGFAVQVQERDGRTVLTRARL